MQYQKKYEQWCEKAQDREVAEQLIAMKDDEVAKKNAFYKDLEFGTAGLRGVMGAGSNCLNVYTIRKATQGVALYMKQRGMTRACVTHDSRLNSHVFAKTVASVLASNGIMCYFTKTCEPTPFLSFMTRHFKCDIGINITASHNPSQYNGYKVYDNKGCQITEVMAKDITECISNVDAFEVTVKDYDELEKEQLIVLVEESLVYRYIDTVMMQSINRADGISIAYTPLNGTGHFIIPNLLNKLGVEKVDIVQEQSKPDGHFKTCPYPNPEKREALTLAIKLAEEKQSDIVIGTDPDCDRIGVAVRHNGEYVCLTGNEVGVLLCDYILAELKKADKLPKNPIVVKTIVTSIMTDKVAQYYGAQVVDVLTGFKYIGEVIANLEAKGEQDRYVFGFEESCGYLRGTYVRDKDGAVATMLFAEMTATYKKQGKTPVDRLNELYQMFGTFQNKTVCYEFSGADGADRKEKILQDIRTNGFEQIGGSKVVDSCDYLTQTKYNLPKAQVMRFNMENGSQLIIRPSGTEPLIKNYITVCGNLQSNKQTIDNILNQLEELYK